MHSKILSLPILPKPSSSGCGTKTRNREQGYILLLETPFFSQSGGDEVRAYVQSKYNLALLALGSYIRAKSSMDVRLINMVKDRLDADSLVATLILNPPSVVGIPLYSYNLGVTYQIITRLKQEFPSLHVCVGGPHAGMFPAETIRLPYVDSLIVGDGEEPFLQVCQQVLANGALDECNLPPGTRTKASQAAGICPQPWSVVDLDSLPMPDLTLLGDHQRYRDFLSNRTMAILTTSRGCPYTCHYCSSESSKYRSFSVERIIEIMRYYRDQGIEYIEFWDETFNPNKRRLDEFADALLAADLNVAWGIRGSVVLHVPYETLVKLRKTGLRVMQFGVETAQPRLIDYLNKRVDPETIKAAFETCRRAGVRAVANLMVNIPGSTRSEMMADLHFLKKMKPTYVSVSVYNWAPGTTHYANALKDGTLNRDHWRAYAANPSGEEPVLHSKTEIPIEEVYAIRDRFVWRYYFNPGYVLRYLRLIEACEVRRAASIAMLMLRGRVRALLTGLRNRWGSRNHQSPSAVASTPSSNDTMNGLLVSGLPEDSHVMSLRVLHRNAFENVPTTHPSSKPAA